MEVLMEVLKELDDSKLTCEEDVAYITVEVVGNMDAIAWARVNRKTGVFSISLCLDLSVSRSLYLSLFLCLSLSLSETKRTRDRENETEIDREIERQRAKIFHCKTSNGFAPPFGIPYNVVYDFCGTCGCFKNVTAPGLTSPG